MTDTFDILPALIFIFVTVAVMAFWMYVMSLRGVDDAYNEIAVRVYWRTGVLAALIAIVLIMLRASLVV